MHTECIVVFPQQQPLNSAPQYYVICTNGYLVPYPVASALFMSLIIFLLLTHSMVQSPSSEAN